MLCSCNWAQGFTLYSTNSDRNRPELCHRGGLILPPETIIAVLLGVRNGPEGLGQAELMLSLELVIAVGACDRSWLSAPAGQSVHCLAVSDIKHYIAK